MRWPSLGQSRVFHERLLPRIFAGCLGDQSVIFGDPCIELVGVRGDHNVDWLASVLEIVVMLKTGRLPSAAGRCANSDISPRSVSVGGRTFFDKTLPRAVQGENDLLVLFLDRDKTHVGSNDGFANGCRIAASFFPRLPLMRYGVTDLGAISLTVWP